MRAYFRTESVGRRGHSQVAREDILSAGGRFDQGVESREPLKLGGQRV